jgi:hypothetical protein
MAGSIKLSGKAGNVDERLQVCSQVGKRMMAKLYFIARMPGKMGGLVL